MNIIPSFILFLLAPFLGVIGVFSAPSSAATTSADTQRKDDISRFLVAANDYQTNNSGKTPWDSGKTNKQWVRRYIDEDCSADTPEQADDSCSENFRDPDGEPYFFVYKGSLSPYENKKADITKSHGIYVYTNAQCGNDSGSVEGVKSSRQFAMLYKLSDGTVYCNDNS